MHIMKSKDMHLIVPVGNGVGVPEPHWQKKVWVYLATPPDVHTAGMFPSH